MWSDYMICGGNIIAAEYMYQFKVYAVNLSSVMIVIHSSAGDAESSL
jgi:hypothetical protein